MQSVITSKFQTTIPKDVRARLKLSIHDTLEWKVENDICAIRVYLCPKFLNNIQINLDFMCIAFYDANTYLNQQ
jgi:bifunctional DNA-binding transcriptional regulator/antitoxin component of YhaV-PrlF toxin-antitoxin module